MSHAPIHPSQTFNDAVKECVPMGEISYFSLAGTPIAIAAMSDGLSNMVECPVASALTVCDCEGFDNGGADNGRLRYVGALPKHFHIACTMTVKPTAPNKRYVLAVAKSGTVIQSSRMIQRTGATADEQCQAVHAFVELETDDYLSMFIGNLVDDTDVDIRSLNLFAMGM